MVKSKKIIRNSKLLEIQTMNDKDFKRYYGVSKSVFFSLCEKLPKEIKQIWVLWLFSFAKMDYHYLKPLIILGTLRKLSQKKYDLTKNSDRNFHFALTALDTTVFPIRTMDDQFYSIKHSKRCLKYEAIVTLDKGTCCHLTGPHVGSELDLVVYIKEVAHLDLLPGEKIFADEDFCCNEFSSKLIRPIKKTHETMLTNEEHCFNNWVSSNGIIVKNFFKDLKKFEILKDWRSSIDKHMKMVYFLTWVVNEENKTLYKEL
ncbi:hypothetical protein DDB_G0282883 [Dictyostelium discoideum AX4]|uniref:DDE Tnp4 domain-containing protein n=1 Tax=Dictyostelium discoideum TaxID=44689 RepID=Q54RV8_DICDI|nr:hypothetical protein DDB_G0282883 [Dictyostelium discoideum AX4]EAL66021.1 hypothetical protein DDB_G0282883 [Dictyostelium discoideum AX4]|eukprot:XP_639379.1 hypothetical protein DDB_G0282883 [Dictyostelium discoideum AX4]